MNESKRKGVGLAGVSRSLPRSVLAFERPHFARALDEAKTSGERAQYSPHVEQQPTIFEGYKSAS